MVSIELRELIVANAKAGITVDEIRRVLRVGKSTILNRAIGEGNQRSRWNSTKQC